MHAKNTAVSEVFPPLVPGSQRGAAEINSVDEKLEGLGLQLDAVLPGTPGSGPAEGSLFEAFGGDPEAGAVKVKELDAVAPLVGEDEQGVPAGVEEWCLVASSWSPLKDLRMSQGSTAR